MWCEAKREIARKCSWSLEVRVRGLEGAELSWLDLWEREWLQVNQFNSYWHSEKYLERKGKERPCIEIELVPWHGRGKSSRGELSWDEPSHFKKIVYFQTMNSFSLFSSLSFDFLSTMLFRTLKLSSQHIQQNIPIIILVILIIIDFNIKKMEKNI